MPENDAIYQERLASLRNQIENLALDGLIIPRTDEFQGEFLAPYAERLAWLTGFTGSAGAAVILSDKAVVMSDGRYTIQLTQQVNSDLYQTADSTKTSVGQWLAGQGADGLRIGYDAWLHTPSQIEKINEDLVSTNITLVPIAENPIDAVWHDQPAKPLGEVIIFPDAVAGKTSKEKRSNIAKQLKKDGISASLITMSDSICWLLNIRGADIDFSPLVLSYAVLYDDGALDWFVDSAKINDGVRDALGNEITIKPINQIENVLGNIHGHIAMDTTTAPIAFENIIVKTGGEYKTQTDPCAAPKAIKTLNEQAAIRDAHIKDGIAIVKFLKWLDDYANNIEVNELSVEERLEEFRRECPEYLGASFSTIAGFAGNGAIVHYRATPETSKDIKGDGLLLVDSGGQYKWGTTDITRTIGIGEPSQEMKENYTRVLKGHIAVASAEFKQGTCGKDIDVLARKPLQDVGLDYAHGTGHGVGCYLCVHEDAAHISPRGLRELQDGMLLSNEPGYYKEGEYGIRLENLVFVQKKDECLYFETVTFAPFSGKMILMEQLSDTELEWLNHYHQKVTEILSAYLDQNEKDWLRKYISMA